MAEKKDKGYRRSWKNLLINKRYQLRFTLFMVGLSTVLMLGLGIWVLREAQKATTVGINDVLGRDCVELARDRAQSSGAVVPEAAGATPVEPDSEEANEPAPGQAPAVPEAKAQEPAADRVPEARAQEPAEKAEKPPAEEPSTETPSMDGAADPGTRPDEPAPAAEPPAPAAAGEGAAPGERPEGERAHIQVDIGEMHIQQPAPDGPSAAIPAAAQADIERCKKEQEAQIAELKHGYRRIKLVLSIFGLIMVLGLTFYGIKTTHKVAGPLHKLTLYFDKMRNGVYDQVYSLRKGDQLVEFYEQFKAAHAGLRALEQKDIDVLRDVLEAAEKDNLSSRSPELAALLGELRQTLQRKEKSLE